MKGIDPKWTMYLGLLVAVEQAIGHGTVSLTDLIPEEWAPYVTSWCNFLAFVGTSIMTYQAAMSAARADGQHAGRAGRQGCDSAGGLRRLPICVAGRCQRPGETENPAADRQ
jgi:hypothetical protein